MNKELIKQKFELFYDYLMGHNFNINKEKCLKIIDKINKEKDYHYCIGGKYFSGVFTVETNSWGVEFSLILDNVRTTAIYDLQEGK